MVKQAKEILPENLDESEKSHNEGTATEDEKKEEHSVTPKFTRAEVYGTFVIEVKSEERKLHNLNTERCRQIRIQFLYKDREQKNGDRFLVLIHQECKNYEKFIDYPVAVL